MFTCQKECLLGSWIRIILRDISLIPKTIQAWKFLNGSLISVSICHTLFMVKFPDALKAWKNSQTLCFITYLRFPLHIVMAWWIWNWWREKEVIDWVKLPLKSQPWGYSEAQLSYSLLEQINHLKLFTRFQTFPWNDQFSTFITHNYTGQLCFQ